VEDQRRLDRRDGLDRRIMGNVNYGKIERRRLERREIERRESERRLNIRYYFGHS